MEISDVMRVIRTLVIAFLFSSHADASLAQGKGKLDSATAAAAARACYEHISGKNPTPTLDKSGFSKGMKGIRGAQNYNKKIRGGLFSSSIKVISGKKKGQKDCVAATLRTNVPEQTLLVQAFRKELSSRGNKQTFRKNALGGEWEIWVGPIGSYELNAPDPYSLNQNFTVRLKPRK